MARRLTNDEFIKKVEDLTSDYLFLEDYVNSHVKLKVRHISCGNEYMVKPNKFITAGRRCPKCNGGKRYSNQDFLTMFNELANDEYTILEEYTRSHSPLKMQHKLCGNVIFMSWSNFKQGYRCKHCTTTESKAVLEIKEYLIDNNIEFELEKKFEECKYKRCLPFDFYLPEFNLLIEYDGEQHYRAWSGCPRRLQLNKKRDAIKTNFAINSNYNFLRIAYTENHLLKLYNKLINVQRLSKP